MIQIPTKMAEKELQKLFKSVAHQERVVFSQGRKKVAALISIEDFKLLEALEEQRDIEDAKKALKEVEQKGSIPWQKVKTSLGL